MKRWLLGLLGVLVLIIGGALVFLLTPAAVMPEGGAALSSTDTVTIEKRDIGFVFRPMTTTQTGLIFYPGGRVPPEAYAPAASHIAAHGFLVVIVPMPFNLAFFNANAAGAVRTAYPEITHWAIGGHSLGGAMACDYVSKNPGAIEGLVFFAAYCASDISTQPLQVVSIYGSLEHGKPDFTSAENQAHVPSTTRYVEIPGGNHEQFGYYTGQPNDPSAQIARAEQQAQAVAATLTLLQALAQPR